MKKARLVLVGAVVAAALAGAGAVGTAGAALGACSNSTLAPGTYVQVTVTGVCSLPAGGTVRINGSLFVAPGGAFNGGTMATLTVGNGIRVGAGGILVLGCSPEIGCPGTSDDVVNGGITAGMALAVIAHNNTINGNVSLLRGGGGATCDSGALFGGPAYMDLEDNSISGSVLVTGLQSCWFGMFRNDVEGSVSIQNNRFADPDATEVADNVIGGNLTCFANSPHAQVGDSEGGPNIVSGMAFGECASPAAPPGPPPELRLP
jgi:hypothetical protein